MTEKKIDCTACASFVVVLLYLIAASPAIPVIISAVSAGMLFWVAYVLIVESNLNTYIRFQTEQN